MSLTWVFIFLAVSTLSQANAQQPDNFWSKFSQFPQEQAKAFQNFSSNAVKNFQNLGTQASDFLQNLGMQASNRLNSFKQGTGGAMQKDDTKPIAQKPSTT